MEGGKSFENENGAELYPRSKKMRQDAEATANGTNTLQHEPESTVIPSSTLASASTTTNTIEEHIMASTTTNSIPSTTDNQQITTSTTTILPPEIITTTTTTTIPEDELTIYCDACGKARVLKKSFAEEFDLSKEWTCELACKEGCNQPDDELANIAGEMFAKVLDSVGIKTRKELASSDSAEFDSGPWEAYIIDWITKARAEETNDAMMEIFQDTDLIEELARIEIETPWEVVQLDTASFVTLVNEVLQRPDLEDQVETWKALAASIVESAPWMGQA
jgi:hypothetical protein